MWLAANALNGGLRWFQITGTAISADATAISTFVRARRPTDMSPIGIVFDEVSSSNTDLWNVLAQELRRLPAVFVLGSVRQEDVNLIASQADTEFIPVNLNPDLARAVWAKLSAANQTAWSHWREPFEQSKGLMLEYVHLLTEGKRLSAVIGDQDTVKGTGRSARRTEDIEKHRRALCPRWRGRSGPTVRATAPGTGYRQQIAEEAH